MVSFVDTKNGGGDTATKVLGRDTTTYSVASVVTVMVFVCLLVERSIYRFGRWLKKTRRKALFASLEKIKEELMLLGLISLLLAQSARWISEICVNSSLFTSQFYICSERDYSTKENAMLESSSPNKTEIPRGLNSFSHQCGEGHEPFVSYEGLEQLHRFLFVLGITHVLYSCLAVALAMSKIYSWRKWENLAELAADANLQGLNIYFWLSFIPAILVMLVGTKLQHVVSSLALEIVEQTGPATGTQNAFEMATFLWSLWGLKERSCFMKNHVMIVIRLTSGVLVQFWCSYSTAPLNVIVTQMGSRCKKALVAESVRDSLHSWCKRVKERSRRDSVHSHATRSVCSLDTTIDERDEITVASGTLSRSSSLDSLHQVTVASAEQPEAVLEPSEPPQHEYSFRVEEYLSESVRISASQPPTISDEDDEGNGMEEKVDTLLELFQKT
ncbi:hypothetical protein Pyn_03434 [Prunus yedoensis var. nudiflora]|uniref:MLO-like protein n=1 Tax=Prunus yedoensis var. nudiflora TaxID=2094558 RepID=A0A314YZY1_PRUYE|nr:hypothetical protein Pyn_03434 [Prunus yedoensis var. nudiflora]